MRASLLVAALLAGACSSTPAQPMSCEGSDAGACSCGPGVDSPPSEGAVHVTEPSTVSYRANPPASGSHWPQWQTPWGAYPDGLPRERWVHNLEHGGIVLLYNCPDGCADDVAQLTAIMQGRPPDQFNEVRILLLPDSLMPHKFAAVAWLWRWQGDAVDAAAINCFIEARYDRGPESIP